jgi:hypothetical protein
MQDLGYELPRKSIPRTPVNKGKIKAGRPVPGPSSRLYSLLGTVMRTASPARPRLIRARTVRVSQRRRCHSGQRQKASKQSRYNSLLHHFTSLPFLHFERLHPRAYHDVGQTNVDCSVRAVPFLRGDFPGEPGTVAKPRPASLSSHCLVLLLRAPPPFPYTPKQKRNRLASL